MKINGKNKRGKAKNTAEPRKDTRPTRAEKRLSKRVKDFNATPHIHSPSAEANGFHKPGSLKKA